MFLVALGLAGLLFGVGSSEVRRFENAAARDISTKLSGEAKTVKVRTKIDPFQVLGGRVKSATITASNFGINGLPFFTQPNGSHRGQLNELKIELSNFELTGLHVRRLQAKIPNCRFDLGLAQRHGQIRLTQSGTGLGSVEVTQDSLLDFVKKKQPLLRNVTLRIADGKVYITGDGRFLAFEASVAIEGKLTSPDGNRIEVIEANVTVNKQEANPIARKAILDFINPVLDLNKDLKLFSAIYVQRIELRDNALFAAGPAHIPDQPLGTWFVHLGLLFP